MMFKLNLQTRVSDAYSSRGFLSEKGLRGGAEGTKTAAKSEWCLNALKWRQKNKLHLSSGI